MQTFSQLNHGAPCLSSGRAKPQIPPVPRSGASSAAGPRLFALHPEIAPDNSAFPGNKIRAARKGGPGAHRPNHLSRNSPGHNSPAAPLLISRGGKSGPACTHTGTIARPKSGPLGGPIPARGIITAALPPRARRKWPDDPSRRGSKLNQPGASIIHGAHAPPTVNYTPRGL